MLDPARAPMDGSRLSPGMRFLLCFLGLLDPHPIRSQWYKRCGIGQERAALADRIEAQEGEPLAVAARSDLAGVLALGGDHCAGHRGGAVDAYREQALFNEAAIFCAGGQLLA